MRNVWKLRNEKELGHLRVWKEPGLVEYRVRDGEVKYKDGEIILDSMGYVKDLGICPKNNGKLLEVIK